MKRIGILLAVLAAGLLTALNVVALGGDNPLKNAVVGDWIEYNTTSEMSAGMKTQMHTKQTVVAKDAKFITLRTEVTMNGKAMPPQETKIPLDQPYEPYKSPNAASVQILGEGSETVTVGAKPYSCHWTKVKVTLSQPAGSEGITKIWVCKDVPVSGMVKMETEMTMKTGANTMNTKMTMEMTGSGHGK